MIKLGSKVRCKITGFEGIAITRTEWLNGCVGICVKPLGLFEGKPIEPVTYDEFELEEVQENAIPE